MKQWKFLVILSLGIVLSSCFKKENYNTVPEIKYDSFLAYGDSARIVIEFTDQEGDIGLNDSQTESPYNQGSEYYYNVYVEYYEKDGANGFVPSTNLDGDTISFPIRLHPILESGIEKPVKGKMEIYLSPLYYNPFSSNSDTIQYRIQIIDRALNKSNWVSSEVIIR